MKLGCACGHEIVDGSGDNPFKGHVIPDQEMDALLEAIDEAVMRPGTEGACMAIRQRIARTVRRAWQCAACSRVYFDAPGATARGFAPEGSADRVPVLGRVGTWRVRGNET